MITFLGYALLIAVVAWLVLSWCNYPRANQVALRCFFGDIEQKVNYGGSLVFVPIFPGIVLFRFPTQMFKLMYEGRELSSPGEGPARRQIWSLDHQLLFPQVTLYLQFPYDSAEHLTDMVQRSVPFWSETALTAWAEDAVIPALRRVLAKRTYKQAIGEDEKDAINTEVNAILKENGSVLRVAGIYGANPDVTDEGTGYARLEVEQVLLTEELQKKLEQVTTSDLDVQVADREAQQKAATTGRPLDLMMAEWVQAEATRAGKSVQTVTEELKASGAYQKQLQTYKDLLLAAGGNLDVNRIEVGAPDGAPLSGDIGGGVAFAGALAALFGKGGQGGRGGRKRNKKEEREAEKEDLKEDLDVFADEK